MDAPAFRIIPQRSYADCAIACLAMLLGVSYDTVLLEFEHNVSAVGANADQMKRVARRLKQPIVSRKKNIDLETDTGILMIEAEDWPLYHLVILKEGQIVDTDSTLWDADVYMTVHKAKVAGIFTLREAK